MFTISLCESNESVSPVAATRTGFCLTRPILNEYSHTVHYTYTDTLHAKWSWFLMLLSLLVMILLSYSNRQLYCNGNNDVYRNQLLRVYDVLVIISRYVQGAHEILLTGSRGFGDAIRTSRRRPSEKRRLSAATLVRVHVGRLKFDRVCCY